MKTTLRWPPVPSSPALEHSNSGRASQRNVERRRMKKAGKIAHERHRGRGSGIEAIRRRAIALRRIVKGRVAPRKNPAVHRF